MGETTTELPEFDLATGGGGRLRNSDLLGRRTVLYFYPKDDTPGCTLEGQEFTRLLPEFETPYTATPARSNSGSSRVNSCPSRVQPGVSSFG